MGKKSQVAREQERQASKRTPTFLLELPLQVSAGQAARVCAHLEAGRQFYNAVLSQGLKRLRAMRADPAWQAARAIPRTHKQERSAAFQRLREQYGFSEYALHEAGKALRVSWLADHLDAVLAQTLASRAYLALNRVCLGKAKRVRFKSRGRGLSSIENKRTDTGLRFVLQKPAEGNQGWLLWKDDRLAALIDWQDPVVKYGLDHPIKYARLVQRKASSAQARGADPKGYRYFVQLALEGVPYHKPKHAVGHDIIMDRQRRAANPDNYDNRGRIKKAGQKRLHWKQSKGYQKTRRRKAEKERRLAAHRKSLHGRKVHEIVAVGNTIILEKISYKAWQKQYGRSIGMRAPGMFVEHLRRTVASTGGTLLEVPTRQAKLSQFCHGCGRHVKKPLSQRWHHCPCGIGPVQRDLYAAFLASTLDQDHLIPSCAQAVVHWEASEARLRAAQEGVLQRANEGQSLPRSFGMPRAGARRPSSLSQTTQEPTFLLRHGKLEAWKCRSEPPLL